MSRNGDQQRLPLPPPQLTPGAGLGEPRLWVRRLLLWRDFGAGPVRTIEFHRGLNVITSPPGPAAEGISTGHAAGKTLFCRQVRFCLGEDSFADLEDTVAIRSQFRDGGIGAEIRVCGQTWVVRRAFSEKGDDRAAKSERFEDLADDARRGTFSSFRAELDTLAFNDVQLQLLDELEDLEVPWQYLLAWLTRDQECRLDGLTHWRHPDSSSHSPVRKSSAETRLNLVRAVLGLYSAQSNTARRRVEDAAKAVGKAESDTRLRDQRFTILREDLAKALGLDERQVWPPSQELFHDEQSAREAHFRRLESLADERIRAVRPVQVSDDQRADEDELERTVAELAAVQQQVGARNETLRLARAHLELLTMNTAKASSALRHAKNPTCPFDDTRLDVERAQFVCPLPRLPNLPAAQQLADEQEEHRSKIADEVAAQEDDLATLNGRRASLETRKTNLERRVAAHQLRVSEASTLSQAAWAAKGTLRRFADSVREHEEAQQREDREKNAQKLVLEERNSYLSSYSTAKITTWFDFLVTRIVAAEASGEIKLDGRGLHAVIEWRGRRRSVAINSLAVVLFDLAAMLCAVEGDASAPAFLLHDSPREGDLDPWTYARLFETVFALGRDEQTAPFQYIVTTTTEPPAGEIRKRIRDELSARSRETRFFTVDL